MAVRIDIRPRITLREERSAPRRRFQLPPLTLPAVGYWAAMAALTYFFAGLGDKSFDSARAAASEVVDRAPPEPLRAEAPEPPTPPLAATTASAEPEPAPVALEQPAEPEAETEPERDNRRTLSSTLAGRTEERASVEREREHEPAPEQPLARLDEPAPRLTFPEFTDSSAPTRRERASDGPRLDGLFERRADEPGSAPPPATAPETERSESRALPSCEAAVARNNETIELGAPRGPADITREAYASILQNGSYLSGCAIPDRTVFEICAAVRDGRAVGVTVSSSPPSASLNACVRRAVSRLKFPSNPRLDVTHTRFDAARR